jgi:hypothetical protein
MATDKPTGGWSSIPGQQDGHYDAWGYWHAARPEDRGLCGVHEPRSSAQSPRTQRAPTEPRSAAHEGSKPDLRLLTDADRDAGLREQEPPPPYIDGNPLREPLPPKVSDAGAMRLLARAWRRVLNEQEAPND